VNGWRLRWKPGLPEAAPGLIDGRPLNPDEIGNSSRAAFGPTRLRVGREDIPLEQLFDIEELQQDVPGNEVGGPLVDLDGCERFVHLGDGMESGRLVVHGSGGTFVGARQRGGEIHVHGSVDESAGAAMTGGTLVIDGDAGDAAGGPLPGGLRGLDGGELLIQGNAGRCLGFRQRRGLIAVAGKAGEFPGQELRAGTILVGSGDLVGAGLGMRRGSIIGLDSRPPQPDGFTREGPVRPTWLRVLLRRLQALGFSLPPDARELLSPSTSEGPPLLETWTGDKAALHRGEILVPLR